MQWTKEEYERLHEQIGGTMHAMAVRAGQREGLQYEDSDDVLQEMWWRCLDRAGRGLPPFESGSADRTAERLLGGEDLHDRYFVWNLAKSEAKKLRRRRTGAASMRAECFRVEQARLRSLPIAPPESVDIAWEVIHSVGEKARVHYLAWVLTRAGGKSMYHRARMMAELRGHVDDEVLEAVEQRIQELDLLNNTNNARQQACRARGAVVMGIRSRGVNVILVLLAIGLALVLPRVVELMGSSKVAARDTPGAVSLPEAPGAVDPEAVTMHENDLSDKRGVRVVLHENDSLDPLI